jgi:hypothetical protein
MDKEYKNRISDKIDSVSKSFSKTELEQHIADLEYQIREIKEHGLGDSDAALTKWRIERELLLAYEDYLDKYDTEDRIKQVDKYLKNKYWEKPKKIELDLENMASGEMIGNIKGLKK